jgi:hypothetical protein
MTTRVKGLTVVLDKDYRDDDVEFIINAIGMIKGVIRVGQIEASQDDWVTESRIRNDVKEKLYELMREL